MTPEQLETRIQEALDGILAEEHWEELREELKGSEESRELYCRYAQLNAGLRERSKGIQALHAEDMQQPAPGFAKGAARKRMQQAIMASVGVLVLVLGIWLLGALLKTPPPLVVFTSTPGTSYVLTHQERNAPPARMALWDGSRLQISGGAVELRFITGVKSVVVGPADVTLRNQAHLHMDGGEARFVVPVEAIGTRVTTRYLDVVDLGTEFGIQAFDSDHHEIHVIKGKVKAAALNDQNEAKILVAGKAERTEPVGGLRTIPCEPTAFVAELPKKLAEYRGPLDLQPGVHALGKAGVGYTVHDSVNTQANFDGVVGNLQIDKGGSWSSTFSQPVDLRIEPPDLPLGVWNSDDDIGQINCSPDAVVTVDDPAEEIRLTELSPGLFRWEFLKTRSDPLRHPANQTWVIRVERTDAFTISKSVVEVVEEPRRAAFRFLVSTRPVNEGRAEPIKSE